MCLIFVKIFSPFIYQKLFVIKYLVKQTVNKRSLSNKLLFSFPFQVNETTHLGESQKIDELYDIPVGATTTDLPAGVLYRVSNRNTYLFWEKSDVADVIYIVDYFL